MTDINFGLEINGYVRTLLTNLGDAFSLESGADARQIADAGRAALRKRRGRITPQAERECRTAVAVIVRLGELQALDMYEKTCRNAMIVQQYLDRDKDVPNRDLAAFSELHRMIRDGETGSARRWFSRNYGINGAPSCIRDDTVRTAFDDVANGIEKLPAWIAGLLY